MDEQDKGHNWWREMLGNCIGILVGVPVFAVICITGGFILEANLYMCSNVSQFLVWLALFFILAIGFFGAREAGKWARTNFVRTRKRLMNTVIASCIGITTGGIVSSVVFLTGAILMPEASSSTLRLREVIWLGTVLLACIISFLSAFVAGHLAERYLAGTITENLPETNIAPSVAILMIAHVTPLIILLLSFLFVVPICQELFAGVGGVLPAPIRLLVAIKDWLRGYWLIAAPSTVALLWGDVHVYLWLHRRGRKRRALVWLWGIFCLMVSLIVLTAWAFIRTAHDALTYMAK